MAEPQAYLNGRYVPASQAVVSVSDGGFVQGTTVAEQLRTFGGQLFQLEAHLERLVRSLQIVGVDPGLTVDELSHIATELAQTNHALLAEGDDLGLTMFVTPGPYGAMLHGGAGRPTVCLHTFPLRFDLWAAKYQAGEALATTDVVQVSNRSWPHDLKCRSRMHYYLADRQARARFPDSRAVLTDEAGFVTETTTANVMIYSGKTGLVVPPAEKILPGISLAVLLQLADQLQIAHVERDFKPAELGAADEVFLTSTTPCVLPVVRLNGRPIGSGAAGRVYQRLLATWSNRVGLDIAEQARRFSVRVDA